MSDKANELFDGPGLRIAYLQRNSPGLLVVSFTGRDPAPPAAAGAGEGFLAKNDIDAVHVISKKNHWWQTPDWDEGLRLIRAYAAGRGAREIVTYGSSMGGYGALVASKALGAARVVTYAPQFSVDPVVAPWETRWLSDAKAIKFATTPFAELAAAQAVYIFSDPFFEADQRHVLEIARHAPVRHLKVAFSEHDVSRVLSDCGVLSTVTLEALRGTLEVNAFTHSFRTARKRTPLVYGGASRLLHQHRHTAAALLFGRHGFEMLAADPAGRGNAERDRMVLGFIGLLVEHKQATEALSALDRWTSRTPERQFAYERLRAQALNLLGQFPAALEAVNNAMSGRPSERGTHTVAAAILGGLGQPSESLSFFEKYEAYLTRYPASIVAFSRLMREQGFASLGKNLVVNGAEKFPTDKKIMKEMTVLG